MVVGALALHGQRDKRSVRTLAASGFAGLSMLGSVSKLWWGKEDEVRRDVGRVRVIEAQGCGYAHTWIDVKMFATLYTGFHLS